MAYYLGIDCSTQGMKALVIDPAASRVVAGASVRFTADLPEFGCPDGVLPHPDPLVRRAAVAGVCEPRLLRDPATDPAPYIARVRASDFGRRFSAGSWEHLPPADLELATRADCYDFPMPVTRSGDRLVIRAPG